MDDRLESMYRRFTWRILSNEYGGPVTTVVYPEGVHILNNVWHKARPLVADWLVDTL